MTTLSDFPFAMEIRVLNFYRLITSYFVNYLSKYQMETMLGHFYVHFYSVIVNLLSDHKETTVNGRCWAIFIYLKCLIGVRTRFVPPKRSCTTYDDDDSYSVDKMCWKNKCYIEFVHFCGSQGKSIGGHYVLPR